MSLTGNWRATGPSWWWTYARGLFFLVSQETQGGDAFYAAAPTIEA